MRACSNNTKHKSDYKFIPVKLLSEEFNNAFKNYHPKNIHVSPKKELYFENKTLRAIYLANLKSKDNDLLDKLKALKKIDNENYYSKFISKYDSIDKEKHKLDKDAFIKYLKNKKNKYYKDKNEY